MSTAVDELSERGRLLLGAGRYDDAVRLLSRALAQDPDDPRALALMAGALYGTDEPERALDTARRALARNPGEIYALRIAGWACDRLGNYEGARAYALEVVRRAPDDWRSHADAATQLVRVRADLPTARAAAREAVRLGPQEAGAHFAMGLVAQTDKTYEVARRAYQETLRLEPGHAMARNNLAVLELRRGRVGQGMRGVVDALRLDPGMAAARTNIDVVVSQLIHRAAVPVSFGWVVANSVQAQLADLAWPARLIGVPVVLAIPLVWWLRARPALAAIPRSYGPFLRGFPRREPWLTARAVLLGLAYLVLLAGAVLGVVGPRGSHWGMVGSLAVVPLILSLVALVVAARVGSRQERAADR